MLRHATKIMESPWQEGISRLRVDKIYYLSWYEVKYFIKNDYAIEGKAQSCCFPYASNILIPRKIDIG